MVGRKIRRCSLASAFMSVKSNADSQMRIVPWNLAITTGRSHSKPRYERNVGRTFFFNILPYNQSAQSKG